MNPVRRKAGELLERMLNRSEYYRMYSENRAESERHYEERLPSLLTGNERINMHLQNRDAFPSYLALMSYIAFYTFKLFNLEMPEEKRYQFGDFYMGCFAEDRLIDSFPLDERGEKLEEMIGDLRGSPAKGEVGELIIYLRQAYGNGFEEQIGDICMVVEHQKRRHNAKTASEFTQATIDMGKCVGRTVYTYGEQNIEIPKHLKKRIRIFCEEMGKLGDMLDNYFDAKQDEEFFGIKLGAKAKQWMLITC